MKLKSFEINSYRSCIRTRFPVNDELTGLIGINGAGKSNILNAIVLLRKICSSNQIPRRETESRNECRMAAEIEDGNKKLFMRGAVAYETDERNFDDVHSSDLKFNFREFIDYPKWLNFPLQFIDDFSDHPAFFPDRPERDLMQRRLLRPYLPTEYELLGKHREILPLLSGVVAFFRGINYYSASQFSDPSRCPVSVELEENRPVRRFRVGIGHEQFILDLYKSFKAEDTQYKRYLSTVNKEGLGLIDDIQFKQVEIPSSSYQVKSGGKIEEIKRKRVLIVPIFTVNHRELSPNQLSEGTFKTLAIVFYILTDDSKLLLIEEPEVCVHHGLLSSIISLIEAQSKDKQIIMSTHSDFVLDHLEPDNLLLVKRLADRGTIATPLRKSMSKNDYEALRSYLKESGNLGEYWRAGGFGND